jgi:hypothetical protein
MKSNPSSIPTKGKKKEKKEKKFNFPIIEG